MASLDAITSPVTPKRPAAVSIRQSSKPQSVAPLRNVRILARCAPIPPPLVS